MTRIFVNSVHIHNYAKNRQLISFPYLQLPNHLQCSPFITLVIITQIWI